MASVLRVRWGGCGFFEELLERQVTAQSAQIFILEVDGKPIASETQVIDGDVLYALRGDFDERYDDSSPGTFLQTEILQYFFNSSLSEYNFGVGLNPYKTRWAEKRRQLMRFRMYNQTLYGRFLHSVNRCEPMLANLPGARLLNNFLSGKS